MAISSSSLFSGNTPQFVILPKFLIKASIGMCLSNAFQTLACDSSLVGTCSHDNLCCWIMWHSSSGSVQFCASSVAAISLATLASSEFWLSSGFPAMYILSASKRPFAIHLAKDKWHLHRIRHIIREKAKDSYTCTKVWGVPFEILYTANKIKLELVFMKHYAPNMDNMEYHVPYGKNS